MIAKAGSNLNPDFFLTTAPDPPSINPKIPDDIDDHKLYFDRKGLLDLMD